MGKEGEEDAKKKEVEKSKDEDVKGDTYAKENIEAAKTHLKESDSLLRDLVGNFEKILREFGEEPGKNNGADTIVDKENNEVGKKVKDGEDEEEDKTEATTDNPEDTGDETDDTENEDAPPEDGEKGMRKKKATKKTK